MIQLNEFLNSHIKKLPPHLPSSSPKPKFDSLEILVHAGPNLYECFVLKKSADLLKDLVTALNKYKNTMIFQNIDLTKNLYIVSDGYFYLIDILMSDLLSHFVQMGTLKERKLQINVCCEVILKQLHGSDLIVPSEMSLLDIFEESLSQMKVLFEGNELSLDLSQQRYAIEFADPNLRLADKPKDEIFFYFGSHKITINKSEAKNHHSIKSKILPFTEFEEYHGLKICVIEQQTGTLLQRSNNLIRFRHLDDDPNQETDGVKEGDRVAIIDLQCCYNDSNNQIHVYQFSPDRSLIYSFRVPYELTIKEHITAYPLSQNTTEFDFKCDSSDYYLAYSEAIVSFWTTKNIKNTNMVSLNSKFSGFSSSHILLYYARRSPIEIIDLYKLFQSAKPARSSIIYNHILSELYTTIRCETSFKGLKLKNPPPSYSKVKQEIWYFWNLLSPDPNTHTLIQDVFGKLISEWDGTGELYETIYLMVVGKPQFQNIENHLKELVNNMTLYLMIKPPEPLESKNKRKRGDKVVLPKEQRVIFNVSPNLTLDEIITRSGLFTESQSQKIQFTVESPKGTPISHREIIPETVKTSIETPLELFWKKSESYWGTKIFPYQQELLTSFSAIHKVHEADKGKSKSSGKVENFGNFEYFYKITKLGRGDYF